MSYCRKEGKDEIIFVTKDDFKSSASENPLLPDKSEAEGLIKENGEINWDCPCLQGMGDGPCGQQFKDAFSCFHYSESEPKGADCLPQFQSMQDCFIKYPEIYGNLDDDENNDSGTQSTDGSDPEKTAVTDNTEDGEKMSGQIEKVSVDKTSS